MLPTYQDFPKTVIIGGVTYSLHFVVKIPAEYTMPPDTVGCCDAQNRRIYLKIGTGSHADNFSTFIHEVLHAFETEYGLKLSHKLVYGLERAIFDFIVANLGKFIQKG